MHWDKKIVNSTGSLVNLYITMEINTTINLSVACKWQLQDNYRVNLGLCVPECRTNLNSSDCKFELFSINFL